MPNCERRLTGGARLALTHIKLDQGGPVSSRPSPSKAGHAPLQGEVRSIPHHRCPPVISRNPCGTGHCTHTSHTCTHGSHIGVVPRGVQRLRDVPFRQGCAPEMKAATRLTGAKIATAKIPSNATELKLWDAVVSGLCLRIRSGGSRSWVYRYRSDGGRSAKIRSISGARIRHCRSMPPAPPPKPMPARSPEGSIRRSSARRSDAARRRRLACCWRSTGPMSQGPWHHQSQDGTVEPAARAGALHGIDIAKLSRRDLVEALEVLPTNRAPKRN